MTSSVSRVLEKASEFVSINRGDRALVDTYLYFTRHPVAPLNKKRLLAIEKEVATLKARHARPLRVADLACGGGVITSCLRSAGHHVVGIDSSTEEITIAQRFATFLGDDDSPFLCRDLLQPSWQSDAEELLSGKPDVVVLGYALHHLPQVRRFLSDLGAWLPQGAVLVINEENPWSPLFRTKDMVRALLYPNSPSESHRSFRGWKRLLEHAHFSVGEPQGLDVLPMPVSLCWSLVFVAHRRAVDSTL